MTRQRAFVSVSELEKGFVVEDNKPGTPKDPQPERVVEAVRLST